MIWFKDEKVTIRDMAEGDAKVFADGERAQGWNAYESKYLMRLKDHAAGRCVALTAEYEGSPAGYINVYFTGHEGPFADSGWPVIVDFGVLQKYQKKGIGTRLMDTAESIAGKYAGTVWLAVGLHNGYGSAQRMYVKRGYIPDGSGVWYRGRPCTPYDTIWTNDDDMVLYMSKKLPFSGRATPAAEGAEGIRQAGAADAEAAADLACALWPDHTPEEMRLECAALIINSEAALFLYIKNGQPVGFAQCQIRHDYVEGTQSSPVGYLEGIYVQPPERRQGIARALLMACENWARERGCAEFASDCELDNTLSQMFHQAVGFEEANRIVHYVRKL